MFRVPQMMACLRVYYRQGRHDTATCPPPMLGRIKEVRPSYGDVYYLRALLLVRAAMTPVELRTVDHLVHPTYQSAAKALHLFAEHNEAELCLQEAVCYHRSPAQLRFLFVLLAIDECPLPRQLYDRFAEDMAAEFLNADSGNLPEALQTSLGCIAQLFDERGKDLTDYGLPHVRIDDLLLRAEAAHWGPRLQILHARAQHSYASFNAGQRSAFDLFRNVIDSRAEWRLNGANLLIVRLDRARPLSSALCSTTFARSAAFSSWWQRPASRPGIMSVNHCTQAVRDTTRAYGAHHPSASASPSPKITKTSAAN
jgi:hypothetical protein